MNNYSHTSLAFIIFFSSLYIFSDQALAVEPMQNKPGVRTLPLGPMPISLKHLSVPEVPGLLNGPNPIVVNKAAAIALGKALFWDTNVGSDGIACASCHFHAGADRRIKNQVAPGGQ